MFLCNFHTDTQLLIVYLWKMKKKIIILSDWIGYYGWEATIMLCKRSKRASFERYETQSSISVFFQKYIYFNQYIHIYFSPFTIRNNHDEWPCLIAFSCSIYSMIFDWINIRKGIANHPWTITVAAMRTVSIWIAISPIALKTKRFNCWSPVTPNRKHWAWWNGSPQIHLCCQPICMVVLL